jgi:metal-sulfur cluster biosynthetic enzyme
MPTAEDVYTELKQVFDPEIPVNIVDLGLIYDVVIDGEKCNIRMTLTSQSCPAAKSLPDEVKRRAEGVAGIKSSNIEVVWAPAWSPQMITPEGRAILGIGGEDEDEDQ